MKDINNVTLEVESLNKMSTAMHICFFKILPPYTLKNKGSLLASTVLSRTLKMHGIFPFHKRFFKMEKSIF